MRDLDPGSRPGLAGNAGEQGVSYTTIPIEVVGLLGEETVQSIVERVDSIAELSSIAETANPFDDDTGCPEVDLSFLKPEQAEQIRDFNAGRWNKTCIAPINNFQTNRLRLRLGRHAIEIEKALKTERDTASSDIEAVNENIEEAFGDYDREDTALDLATVRSYMKALDEASKCLPSKSSAKILENILSATLETDRHLREVSIKSGSRFARSVEELGFMQASRSKFKGWHAQAERLNAQIQDLRRLGTRSHRKLITVARTEEVREAARLLGVIEVAQGRLPQRDQVGEDQVDTVSVAEQYLAGQVDMARSTIASVEPGFLRRQEIQAQLRRVGTLGVASALESSRHQPVVQETEAAAVNVNVTEARDIFRGGRRLKPRKGQSEKQVQQQSDALHALKADREGRLLEAEESGVIMSILTGKFDRFVEVLGQVKTMDGNTNLAAMPIERKMVIRQLGSFDLNGALTKIRSLLEDPSTMPQLTRIIGFDGVKTVQKTLQEALEPEN